MDGRSLKRPSEGEPSGSSQRQRVEGHASGGFASGPAGRDHLRFTGTTREAHDQTGPSRQRDAQLNTEDSKILEHYTEYIFSDDPKK